MKKSEYQKMRLQHLKVKVKSLAAEAIIIRQEERKSSGTRRNSLAEHRKGTVRWHSRINLLAYGLLRGVPYKVMEQKVKMPIAMIHVFGEVNRIAKRFGGKEEDITKWISDAKEYLNEN